MRPNPLNDAARFLTQAGWFTPIYWLLLLASIVIAIVVWRRVPDLRTPRNLGIWGLRVLIGTMWWKQTLWKIPPNFAGLQYWMQQEADHAAIVLQGDLVRDVERREPQAAALTGEWIAASGAHDVVQDERLARILEHCKDDFAAKLRLLRIACRRQLRRDKRFPAYSSIKPDNPSIPDLRPCSARLLYNPP